MCGPLGALKEEREKGSNELSQHLWNGIFARVPIPPFYGEHSNFSAAMEPGKERILENWEKARGLFLASASDFPLFSRSSQALLAGSKALFGASLLPKHSGVSIFVAEFLSSPFSPGFEARFSFV